MAHKRVLAPDEFATGPLLTRHLVGIGFNFGGEGLLANIEDTLVAASIEGLERDDLRVLSVLVDWLDVHLERVNADRLQRLVPQVATKRVQAFWSSVANWKRNDARFRAFRRLKGPTVDLLRVSNAFQLARRGEDERFLGTRLKVPAGVLRHREGDVLSPGALAKRHPAYRERIRTGPSYRADAWAELEREPTLSAAELARRIYSSFAAAWEARRDFVLLA